MLVHASLQDMRRIKEIISQLDHVLPQLLIEAVTMEVALKNTDTSSISLFEGHLPAPDRDRSARGTLSNHNSSSITRFVPATEAKPKAGQVSGFAYIARLSNDLDALVASQATNSAILFLQHPRIQTSEGEAALIFVGGLRRSRTPTSTYRSGGAATGYPSTQDLEFGITLEVTPYLKRDGFVELDIRDKIDQLGGFVVVVNVGPVPLTSSREARAKVTVRDRETILLGGLIEKNKTQSTAGIPLLKDIPALGRLFRRSSPGLLRNELMILIRATLLPDEEVAALPVPSVITRGVADAAPNAALPHR